ncbi:arrestin domain-containing protein 3-like [Trichomycterus rosablanca]|uniref:arrestin domain-containing protein 3-like n=1 Tax=Trichomycterus rosablanca TaxID=2290929 RepID=UPI002F35B241
MSGAIKQFSISYDAVNESNMFTNGDVINGRVILEVNKEVKVEKLYIKCKGEANVHWTEHNSSNNSDDSYSAHERYFKFKQIFIWDNSKKGKRSGSMLVTNGETYNNVIMPGYHDFPFTFVLPQSNTPSSFKGAHGSIKYILEARLSRSWKMTQTASREFVFVSSAHEHGAELLQPLSGAIDKKMKLFTSGSVSVRASTDKMGYEPGETIKVEAHIENSSSRDLKLKFKLEQRQTFTAQSRHNYSHKLIFKAVEDPAPSRSKKTVTSRLKIPPALDLSISNCSIIKVEYILKVYLDVPYARDPEIAFPVVILQTNQNFPSHQNQAANHSYWNTHDTVPQAYASQPAFGPTSGIAAAASPGLSFGLYPNLYPQQPANPDEPPPSYTDIFPDSNTAAPAFHPSPLNPAHTPLPYATMLYPPASAPQHHPAPEYPSTPGYWPGPANSEC